MESSININNIFKHAYFGKHYKTRDGRKAIYFYQTERNRWHELIVEGETVSLPYQDNGLAVGQHLNNAEWPEDIVSEWKDEINEEELDRISTNDATNYGYAIAGGSPDRPMISFAFREGFKTGYRKAFENKNN